MRQPRESLLGSLLKDPWRKLIALGLAILLWFFLDAQVNKPGKIDFRPEAVDVNEPLTREQSGTELEFRIPTQNFTVLRFEDATSGKPIDQVTLHLWGPTHRLQRCEDNPRFFVEPASRELRNITDSYEFDRYQVKARIPEFLDLVREMTPSRVKVVLERNDSRAVILSVKDLRITPPPERDFLDRIVTERAVFLPDRVILRGTRRSLSNVFSQPRKLFNADLSHYVATDSSAAKVQLELMKDLQKLKITIEGMAPRVTLPLRPKYVSYELQLQVHLLFDDPASTNKWQQPPKLPFKLLVSGTLEAELSNLDADQRQVWISRRAFLIVRVPRNVESETSVVPRFGFYDTSYKEGQDYRFELKQEVYIRPKVQ